MSESPPQAAATAADAPPSDVSMTDSPPHAAAASSAPPADEPSAGWSLAQGLAAPTAAAAAPTAEPQASDGASSSDPSSTNPSPGRAGSNSPDPVSDPGEPSGTARPPARVPRGSSQPPLTTPPVPSYPYRLRPRQAAQAPGQQAPWWSANHELTNIRSATYAFLAGWAELPADERARHLVQARAGLEYAILGLARGYGRTFDAQQRRVAQGFHGDWRRAPRMRMLAEFLTRGLAAVAYLHLSPYFRDAVTELPDERLHTLLQTIAEQDLVSVEFFCKLRRLPAFNEDPGADVLGLDAAFASDVRARRHPVANVQVDFLVPHRFPAPHPHLLIVPPGLPRRGAWDATRSLQYASAQHALLFRASNEYQAHMWAGRPRPANWPADMPWPPRPDARGTDWRACRPCGKVGIEYPCGHVPVEPAVELRDYGAKGVGVRALEPVQPGDILAEYTGLMIPAEEAGVGDTTYQYSIEKRDVHLYTL